MTRPNRSLHDKHWKAIVPLILIAEVVVAAYLALLLGLLSAWMVDDDPAFRMTDWDWLVEGCGRFGRALLVAAVFGGVASLVHRRWIAPLGAEPRPMLGRAPALLAGCIALSGAAGATWFVVTKPYL